MELREDTFLPESRKPFYNKFNREKKIRSYLNKLSELGYDLTAVTVSS